MKKIMMFIIKMMKINGENILREYGKLAERVPVKHWNKMN